jgi:hypothetical protein
MLDRILHFVERELLNHALDALLLCKVNRFFTVEGVARWPAVDRGAFVDQRDGVDGDVADSCAWLVIWGR